MFVWVLTKPEVTVIAKLVPLSGIKLVSLTKLRLHINFTEVSMVFKFSI
jgi:hypothetical protein